VPILKGEETDLNKPAQRLLAAWAAMMVMVAEYAEPDMIAVPASDRSFLREKKKPPTHWKIWVGAQRVEQFPLYSHFTSQFVRNESEMSPDGLVTEPNTQTTTICVGEHLLIYVMSSTVGRRIIRRWVLPREIRSGMQQIWPLRAGIASIRWTLYPRLSDRGVALLANHFTDKAAAIAARG
jgi:hypothetical protein